MKNFEFYIEEGKVKKCSKDMELVKSLVNDAIERKKLIELMDINFMSKIIYENSYDVLRNILDALLLIDGYKSYSHEASISYLKKYDVDELFIIKIDKFRYERNSSKYYGKNIDIERAIEIKEFLPKFILKIKNISSEINELL
ncbi:MAG: hypothetical protein ACMXX8_02670 [Candidatus Woesearchaeota archaeon]